MRKLKILVFTFVVIFAFCSPVLAQSDETITVTTFYPSPYGVYNEFETHSNTNLATQGGNVGIGTTNPQAKLDVAGGAKIGPMDNASTTCSSNLQGTLRFKAPNLEYCDGTNWKSAMGGGTGDYPCTCYNRFSVGGTRCYLTMWKNCGSGYAEAVQYLSLYCGGHNNIPNTTFPCK